MYIKKSVPEIGRIYLKTAGIEVSDDWQEIGGRTEQIAYHERNGEVVVVDEIPVEPDIMPDGKLEGERPIEKGIKIRKLPGIGKILLSRPNKIEVTETWKVLDIIEPTPEIAMKKCNGEIEWVPYVIGDVINEARRIMPVPEFEKVKEETEVVEPEPEPMKSEIEEEVWPIPEVTEEKTIRDVPGIGPAYAEKLSRTKIRTIEDMIEAGASMLAEILGCKESKAENIIAAAKEV